MQTVKPSRSEIIEQNIGLVHACANRFRGRGIEYDDLFSSGCIGLIKATDGFDESRGVRFSTYAVPVILGEIKRLFRDGGSVKISRSLKELSLKVARVRDEILKTDGEEPTVSKIAQILDIDEEIAAQAINAMQPTISLTEADEEGGGQIDVAVQSHEEEITEMLSIKEVILSLPPKDRELIVMRYWQNKTQSVVAQKLGMTQVQVSRREKKLLTFLRQHLNE
jgi:RNA polymerase sporulation-specific sigma factor